LEEGSILGIWIVCLEHFDHVLVTSCECPRFTIPLSDVVIDAFVYSLGVSYCFRDHAVTTVVRGVRSVGAKNRIFSESLIDNILGSFEVESSSTNQTRQGVNFLRSVNTLSSDNGSDGNILGVESGQIIWKRVSWIRIRANLLESFVTETTISDNNGFTDTIIGVSSCVKIRLPDVGKG
jgi:hypothetical protein